MSILMLFIFWVNKVKSGLLNPVRLSRQEIEIYAELIKKPHKNNGKISEDVTKNVERVPFSVEDKNNFEEKILDKLKEIDDKVNEMPKIAMHNQLKIGVTIAFIFFILGHFF